MFGFVLNAGFITSANAAATAESVEEIQDEYQQAYDRLQGDQPVEPQTPYSNSGLAQAVDARVVEVFESLDVIKIPGVQDAVDRYVTQTAMSVLQLSESFAIGLYKSGITEAPGFVSVAQGVSGLWSVVSLFALVLLLPFRELLKEATA
jgi:hypothetical protein